MWSLFVYFVYLVLCFYIFVMEWVFVVFVVLFVIVVVNGVIGWVLIFGYLGLLVMGFMGVVLGSVILIVFLCVGFVVVVVMSRNFWCYWLFGWWWCVDW